MLSDVTFRVIPLLTRISCTITKTAKLNDKKPTKHLHISVFFRNFAVS